jgi:hypothetical protein
MIGRHLAGRTFAPGCTFAPGRAEAPGRSRAAALATATALATRIALPCCARLAFASLSFPLPVAARLLVVLRLPALAWLLLLRLRLLSAAQHLEPRRAEQRVDLVQLELHHFAALELRRHRDASVAHAQQARHGEADRLEQAAHLAVAAFLDDDLVPVVRAVLVAAGVLDLLDLRRAVVELDAALQRLDLLVGEPSEHAHRVLALDLVARMHHPVRELAGVREEQQALGVVVEAAHRDPAAVLDRRQHAEHRGALLGIVARHELAGRLVIDEHARLRLGEADLHRLAVDADLVARADLLPDVAGIRLTVMRPARISSSIARREPKPQLASTLCRRCGSLKTSSVERLCFGGGRLASNPCIARLDWCG